MTKHEFLTVPETALLLNVKPNTLRDWITRQKIKQPESTISGTWFYMAEDIPMLEAQVAHFRDKNKNFYKRYEERKQNNGKKTVKCSKSNSSN